MSLGSKVLTKLEMGILKFLPFWLLLHLISYIDVECAQIKCKIGVERYHNGDCVKCTCSEGDGLSISQMLSRDVTMCPPCSPCSVDEFSGPKTDHLCVNCSTSCEIQNRVTVRQCDGKNDAICGQCLQGFSEDEHNICLSMDEHGRRRRKQLKEEDHTVYFVFAGIAIPAMLCVICYCCLRNKIGSWRRGSAKQCTNPRDCKAHLVYTINESSVKMTTYDPCDSKMDRKTLIGNEES